MIFTILIWFSMINHPFRGKIPLFVASTPHLKVAAESEAAGLQRPTSRNSPDGPCCGVASNAPLLAPWMKNHLGSWMTNMDDGPINLGSLLGVQFVGNLTWRYQRLPFWGGVFFSKASFWVSMVDFRGVNYVEFNDQDAFWNIKKPMLKMDCLFGKTSMKDRST